MLTDFAKKEVRRQLHTMSEAAMLRWLDVVVLEQLRDDQLELLRMHLERRAAERRAQRQQAILVLGKGL